MQGASGFRKTQYQTTGRVFVVRIIFDEPAIASRLTNFRFADVAFNRPAKNVPGKLEFALRQLSENLLQGFHSPELYLIIFPLLTCENISGIVDTQLRRVSKVLAEKGCKLEVTEAAREYLAKAGCDPRFGARAHVQRNRAAAPESPAGCADAEADNGLTAAQSPPNLSDVYFRAARL